VNPNYIKDWGPARRSSSSQEVLADSSVTVVIYGVAKPNSVTTYDWFFQGFIKRNY
jgi:hypothetical protein